MEPTEAPANRGGKKGPTTDGQKIALQTLKTIAPSGESVEREDLIAGIISKLTRGEGAKDRRRRDAERSIDALVANNLIFTHGETRVALTPVRAMAAEEWV